jgi:hypothetical protein
MAMPEMQNEKPARSDAEWGVCMMYAIIGGIHGQAGKLDALLRKMGYRESGAGWRHAGRQAIFVGDFIDRSPEQLRTLLNLHRQDRF